MSDTPSRDFIRQIIQDDLESGKHAEIVTRFPPEPNGYLHIGHIMSICLNFGVAEETGGKTFLRFDDTNPGKEREEYVQAIERDVHWLGFGWGDRLSHASDYFEQLFALYRIRHIKHQHTGDKWCIYPMYDFAHTMSDAIEQVTHSLCTLEFEDHRPLYDWFLDQLKPEHRPRQIEFSRLNLAYTITSKRKLNALIEGGIVSGWDDPRLPTIAGMRRRGYPATALRDFVKRGGVTKKDKLIEMGVLENGIRDELGESAPRRMGVLRPLKVVLSNYPEGQVEMMQALNHPNRPELGTRDMPFTRELFIEQDDFLEDAPRKFFRLKPGGEVRLRFGFIIRCDEVIKNDAGEVVELHCSYDPDTHSGTGTSDRQVKGTIHWVSAEHAIPAEVRLYDRLFTIPDPNTAADIMDVLNPDSFEAVTAMLEPALAELADGEAVQFERLGYFCLDSVDHTADAPVINRIVTLRDSWAKIEKQAMSS